MWVHRNGYGYTGMGVGTQERVWVHRNGCGYTGTGVGTQEWVWVHRNGCGYTGVSHEVSLCLFLQSMN